ncbi:MAG: hypothetical protein JO343_01550, partial [Candidatus Eremiobacteraeota bacterium]|nr:hypothetical protein [Candidatus Eremiobacteraeota bacterium]
MAAPWPLAPVIRDFTNTSTRARASLSTTVRVLYDDRELFVAFECDQHGYPITDSKNIQSVIAGTDDYVAIEIDPSGVGDRVYTFYATPNGLRYQSSSESETYYPRWQAIASRSGDAYAVLLAIPFNALRAPNAAHQDWRINFTRHVAATTEDYSWAFDPHLSNSYDSTAWPLLAGLVLSPNATRPAPHAALYVLGSAGADRLVFQNQYGSFVTLSRPRYAGIDLTVPFTNTTSLVGVANPDYSNVAQDETTIAPQQFARNLTEYRPFFAQGAQYLNPLPQLVFSIAPSSTFYSPSVGIFNEGLKIEGTQGLSSFGALGVTGTGYSDLAYGVSRSRSDGSLSLSLQGAIANNGGVRDAANGMGVYEHNRHSGLNTIATFSEDRGTLVTFPADANNFAVDEGLQNALFNGFAGYQAVGPQYQPLAGYTAVNDIAGPQGFLNYMDVVSGGVLKSIDLFAGADAFHNTIGAHDLSDGLAGVSVVSKSLFSLSLSSSTSEQRIYDAPFPVYAGAHDFQFDQATAALGYKDGTAAPTDASYSFGPFAVQCLDAATLSSVCQPTPLAAFVQAYVQQSSVATTQQLGRAMSVSAEYATTYEQPVRSGVADGQQLRRFSISRGIGMDSSFGVQLRDVSGTGGFAAPGLNLAAIVHIRFSNLNELYITYG